MDTSEISRKLHYVVELLGDLWHYHQAGAHTCPCSVCVKKQSLARSIVAKALQEISLIANCIESSNSYDMRDKLQSDLTASLRYSCETAEQDHESRALKDSPSKRQHSLDLEINCGSEILLRGTREQRKSSSNCSDSLKDSGLNTSLSSQSVSPVLGGKYQYKNISNSQLQVSETLNEISNCCVVKVEVAQNQINNDMSFTTNSFHKRQVSDNEQLSNTRSINSPREHVFTVGNICPNAQSHQLSRRNLPFSSVLNSLQSQPSDLYQANRSLSALTPQSLMLLPVPFVLSSPCFVEELEKYCRYSEQLVKNQHVIETENAADEISYPLSHKIDVAQQTPLTFVHPIDAVHITSTLTDTNSTSRADTNKDNITDVVLDKSCSREELFSHCHLATDNENLHGQMRQSTCVTFSPIQNKQQDYSSTKTAEISTSVQSNCVLDINTTADGYFKEGDPGQQLHVINMQTGSHSKIHHSSQVVYVETQGQIRQSSSACKNDQVISESCHDMCKLTSNTSSQQCCQLICDGELCEKTSIDEDFASDSMWRPWEVKDMIMGLMCADSGTHEHIYQSENSDNGTRCSVAPVGNESIENALKLKARNSSRSSVPKIDCVDLNVTIEQNCPTIGQTDIMRDIDVAETSFRSSSSGSSLVTQKGSGIKQNCRDNLASAIDKNIEKIRTLSMSGIGPHDVDDIKIACVYKPQVTDENVRMNSEEQQHASSDTSLTCLSNVVHAPRKLLHSNKHHNSLIVSPKLSHNALDHDKENENTNCPQEPNNRHSTLFEMGKVAVSTEQSVHHTQHDKSAVVAEDKTSESRLIVQPCIDNAAVFLPPSHLPLSQLRRSLGKQSTLGSSGPLPFSASRCSNRIALGDSPRTTTTPASNMHIQWGAPAVIIEHNSTADHHQRTALENIGEVDMLKTAPKSQMVEQLKSELNKQFTENARLISGPSSTYGNPHVAVRSPDTTNNEITIAKLGCDKRDESVKRSKYFKAEQPMGIIQKGTTTLQENKICLNQTLPADKMLEDNPTNTPKIVNESFEANQSFPKVAKLQQSVTAVRGDQTVAAVCGQGFVTDLHHKSPEWSAKHTPRNRRSIFGYSPPDSCTSQRSQESGIQVKDPFEKSQLKSKSLNGSHESGSKYLWSLLDASDDIGQVPSVQEVLFNCVTSSLCVVDPDRHGKIVSVNESFQCLIGVHEKIVGQKLFRFIKFQNSGSILGLSLPQCFILSDGHLTSVTGKLAYCINASGEPVPVSVWTVPFKPQPKLTMCVIGVSVCMQADIYLSHNGNVLMYSEPFEDILGLTKDSNKRVWQIQNLDFSQVDRPQHTSLQAMDGCDVPVTVALTVNADISLDKEALEMDKKNNSNIYPATLSISINMSGLLIVGLDGVIKFCDKNYFRINLGHCHLEGKHQIGEFLSEIMRVGQNSSLSSPNSSPVLQDKLNTTGSNMALIDVSRLHTDDASNTRDIDVKDTELFLPQSCFSSRGLTDSYDSATDGSDDEEGHSSSTESVVEEPGNQDCLTLPISDIVPYQTSTPCKNGDIPKNAIPKEILLENGIYAALFLHGNGRCMPVSFKLSRIQTSTEALFCLWVYIHPGSNKEHAGLDNDDDCSSENEEKEKGADSTCDEEDLTDRLRHLHFDQSTNRVGDISLGQLLMEQAGLNQSHNATSGTDMLDLEVAVDGSFGKKYMVCEALGQGSFGFVRRARMLDSAESVVVKFIKKCKMYDDSWTVDEKNSGKQIPLEVAILRDTSSEYIIKLLDFHENESFVQMVMEDFGETDLFDFIDQVEIDEPLACYLFRQILWSVDYLHSKQIIHRDIKDENVIVNRHFHCKLIDFGSATYMKTEGALFTKFRGTLEYCSPEVYSGAYYRGPELDTWALGVTLYTILFRENPFTESEVPGHLGDLPHPVTQDVLTLMLGLLEPNPLKRFTVLKALSCDWLRQIVDVSKYRWCELFGDEPLQSDNMTEIGICY